MLECTNCGHKQEVGEFCASCGAALKPASEQVSETVEVEQSPANPEVAAAAIKEKQQASEPVVPVETSEAAEPNEILVKAKKVSRNYLHYLLATLKRPAVLFDAKKPELINGLISFVLFSVFFALTTFLLAHKINKASFYGDVYPVPFFSTYFASLFGIIITAVLIAGAVFLVNKLFGKGSSFLTVLSIYAGHITIPLVLIILGFVLIIINAISITSFLLSGAASLVIGIIPIYIVISLLKDRPKLVDAFYGFLIYILFIAFVTIVLISVLADSFLGNLV